MKFLIIFLQIFAISICNLVTINKTFANDKVKQKISSSKKNSSKNSNKNSKKYSKKSSSNTQLEFFGTADIIDDDKKNNNKATSNTAHLHQLPGKKSGMASYYADRFHGRKTATGEIFNQNLFTGASNHFPLNTHVVVWRSDNGKCVEVKINDRMHVGLAKTRVVDLSRKAAEFLGIIKSGIKLVHIAKKTKNFPGCSNNKFLLAAAENYLDKDNFTASAIKSNLKNISLIADELNDNILYEISDKQFESLQFDPHLIEDLRGKLEAVEDIQQNNQKTSN